MTKKTSAHYQREYRRRQRESGLLKKEIWIRPEHVLKLNEIEQIMRRTDAKLEKEAVNEMVQTQWTTKTLLIELQRAELFTSKKASIELIDGVDPALHISMHEYGDLPIFLTVSGEQIIVESLLWSVDDVIDQNDFNQAVLRTHKYFPLSTISLDRVASGKNYYHMFGALSSASILVNILLEIEMLASNVIKVTEAFSEYLVEQKGEIK